MMSSPPSDVEVVVALPGDEDVVAPVRIVLELVVLVADRSMLAGESAPSIQSSPAPPNDSLRPVAHVDDVVAGAAEDLDWRRCRRR